MDILTKEFVEKLQLAKSDDEIYELAQLYTYLRDTSNVLKDLYDELWYILSDTGNDENIILDENEICYDGKYFDFHITAHILGEGEEPKNNSNSIDEEQIFAKIRELNAHDAADLIREYKCASGDFIDVLEEAVKETWNFKIADVGKSYLVIDTGLAKIAFEVKIEQKDL